MNIGPQPNGELPAMFMIFDPLICHTSIGFAKKKPAKEKKQ